MTDHSNGKMVCVISELLGRHRLSQTALAKASGIRQATINALYHNRTTSVSLRVMYRLLNGLQELTGEPYEIGDVFRPQRAS